MRRGLVLSLALSVSFSAGLMAQNLVPNPSIETCSPCPNGGGQINYATGWVSYMNSPDYFHGCGGSNFGAPGPNLTGTQTAFHGSAYFASVVKFNGSYYREHAGALLTTPLVPGQSYDCSMRVNLADISQYGGNRMGFLFTTGPSSTVGNFAHVFTNTVLTDKVNWVLVSGSFVAPAAYTYVMIGNFYDDANTTLTSVTGGSYGGAYVLFDSIIVRPSVVLSNNQVQLHVLDQADGRVALGWHAQADHEIQNFELERSFDGGETFEVVTAMDAHGGQDYRFADAPGRFHVPILYRVRSFDAGGNTHLSASVEAILAPSGRFAVDVFPSPVNGGQDVTVRFQALSAEAHHLAVMDLAGRVLIKAEVPAMEAHLGWMLPTSQLAPGAYLIEVRNGSKRETERLLVR